MFDRINHTTKTGPEHITIHEHRAPTSDSARLLREMEDRAKADVLNVVRVQNSVIDCVIHRSYDVLNGSTKFLAIFTINGKQHKALFEAYGHEDEMQVATGIRDAIAKEIAGYMLEKCFDAKLTYGFRRFHANQP